MTWKIGCFANLSQSSLEMPRRNLSKVFVVMVRNEFDVLSKRACDFGKTLLQSRKIAHSPERDREMGRRPHEKVSAVHSDILDKSEVCRSNRRSEAGNEWTPTTNVAKSGRTIETLHVNLEVKQIFRIIYRDHFLVDSTTREGRQESSRFPHLIEFCSFVAGFEVFCI